MTLEAFLNPYLLLFIVEELKNFIKHLWLFSETNAYLSPKIWFIAFNHLFYGLIWFEKGEFELLVNFNS